VAVALLGDSKITVLDEPTTGLDLVSKRQVWNQILARQKGRIIIVATQDLEEARIIGSRIGYMHNGKLTMCGSRSFFSQKY